MDDPEHIDDVGDQPSNEFDGLGQPTINRHFKVEIHGWDGDDETEARAFGQIVMNWTTTISEVLDLGRLEKMVIATDYYAALAQVEGGRGAQAPEATQNEYGAGAAMACPVVREDELWSIVVIWTGLVRQLADEEHEHHGLAVHTLFHELVHVDDHRKLSRTYPGGWRMAQGGDARTDALLEIASPFVSEFIAQSTSAYWAPEHGFSLIDMLDKAMGDVDEQIITSRRAYRVHGDMDVFWPAVAGRMRFLFQALGYAVGHFDWIDRNRDQHPELAARYDEALGKLERHSSADLIQHCREQVRPIVDQQEWTGMRVYDGLNAVVEDTLNRYGLYTRLEGGGLYISAPFTSISQG